MAAVRNGTERVLPPAGSREDRLELDKGIRSSIAADAAESAGDAFSLLFDGGIRRSAGD